MVHTSEQREIAAKTEAMCAIGALARVAGAVPRWRGRPPHWTVARGWGLSEFT